MSRLEIIYDGQTILERDVDEVSFSDSRSPGEISLSAKYTMDNHEVVGPTGAQLDEIPDRSWIEFTNGLGRPQRDSALRDALKRR